MPPESNDSSQLPPDSEPLDPQPFGPPRGHEQAAAAPFVAEAELAEEPSAGASPSNESPFKESASPAATPSDAARKPMRFGIRGIFAMTALCSLQFAIISYFGPLIGLAAGIGVCLVVVSGLVVVAFAGQKNETLMGRLDKLAIQLTVAIALLLVTMVIAGGGQVAVTQYSSFSQAWQMQREMGFAAQTRTILDNGRGKRAIIITDVLAGGEFAQAGFLSGDAVVPDDLPPGEFYEFLENNRGSEVTINVATDGALQPLEASTTRAITFTPPN